MTFEPVQASVYLIAGPNGAGKTTFANQFLPDFVGCREFLNADLIASGLSPFAPESQAIRAAGLLLERIEELVDNRRSFAFETTLASRSYRSRIIDWKSKGYRVHLLFLWLPTVEMAVARVANRVRQGGHDIPEQTIRRRYTPGLHNLHELYRPILDNCSVFDSSELPPRLIAKATGQAIVIHDSDAWRECQTPTGEKA